MSFKGFPIIGNLLEGDKPKPKSRKIQYRDKKYRCVECGGRIPRGKLYTCSPKCKAAHEAKTKNGKSN